MNDSETIAVPQPESSEVGPGPDERRELEQALSSRAFEKAPTLRKLLAYLWEKRNEVVSEYGIATEALGRRADFEPRADATVRVQVARLRTRLKEFYEGDGAELTRRIVIPVGSHQVEIVDAPPAAEATPTEVDLPPEYVAQAARRWKLLWIEAAVIVLLLATCVGLMVERNRAVQRAQDGRTGALPLFWRSFLNNNKATRIVVPTPVFFGFGTRILARDVEVNDFSRLDDSPALRTLVETQGKPSLAQQYVAASDALASLRLSQFLDSRGSRLSISTTAESPLDTLDRENLIVTGTPRTLATFQPLLSRLTLQVDAEQGAVLDRRPAAGGPQKYVTAQQSPVRMTTPGVIACMPGGAQGTHVLFVVTTYYTSALVSYLTSESGLRELESARRAHGNAPYFEAVVMSEINGTTELRSHLVEFRPLEMAKQ